MVHLPYLYIWCTVTLISSTEYNFASCLTRAIKLVAYRKGIGEEGAEEDNWVWGRRSNWRLDKTAQWMAAWFVLPTKRNFVHEIKDGKMDGSSSRNGGEANCSAHLQERGSSEDTGTDWSIIFTWLWKKQDDMANSKRSGHTERGLPQRTAVSVRCGMLHSKQTLLTIIFWKHSS